MALSSDIIFLYPTTITSKWTKQEMSFYDSVWYEMMINNVAYLYWKQNPGNFLCPYSVELYDTPIYGDMGNVCCLGVTFCDKNVIQLETVPFFTGMVVPAIANTFAHELSHWILSKRMPSSSSFWENAVHFAYNDSENIYGYRYDCTLKNFLQVPELNVSLVNVDKVIREKDKIENLIRGGQAPQGKNPYWAVA